MKKELPVKRLLVMALLALTFCWFFGIFSLATALIVFKRLKQQEKQKGKQSTLLKWAWRVDLAALAFSAVFTIVYLLAIVSGGYIHWF